MSEPPKTPAPGPEKPQDPQSDAPRGLTKFGVPRKKPGPPKGVRVGGRRKGDKNKTTIEREERDRLIREAAAAALTKDTVIETLDRKNTPDSRRAKKVLETFMELFAGMAATHQPLPPGQVLSPADVTRRQPNPALFKEYATLAIDAAKALAPFQDPRYSAMIVGASIVTKVQVEGGMPNDFAPPVPAGEVIDLKPGTVINAEDDKEPLALAAPAKAENK